MELIVNTTHHNFPDMEECFFNVAMDNEKEV